MFQQCARLILTEVLFERVVANIHRETNYKRSARNVLHGEFNTGVENSR